MPPTHIIDVAMLERQADLPVTRGEPIADRAVAVELSGITCVFDTPDGRQVTALRDLTLGIGVGEFGCVIGPSGCGKSTTLNLVTGLLRPMAGQVRLFDQPVNGISRDIGFVFQTDALFPWRTVLSNVAAGPLYRGVGKAEARARARDWIARVGLTRFENSYPHQLSGGMRKRVALAQTLVNRPRILLMDEPFSALDVQTRTLMQDELLELWTGSGTSVLFVTHDLEEAITLGDKVYVLTGGPGTVKAVYNIDLPRPRRTEEIRYEPEFARLARAMWADLRDEVRQAWNVPQAVSAI
jgi:NitT/TauT family transport system ATP-binding protein